MSKSVRLSEKWFNRILWLIAVLFAWFLIGLGSKVVQYMPKLGSSVTEAKFLNPAEVARLTEGASVIQKKLDVYANDLEQASIKFQQTSNAYQSARDTYENWLASRAVTKRSEQDPEVMQRVKDLDGLKAAERESQAKVESLNQLILTAKQEQSGLQNKLHEMRLAVAPQVLEEQRRNDLRIFMYRLLFTLPLLVAAGWVFKKYRKSTYWPFVMGFSFFALFVFFVELVPYLPNYGGFVRYVVGIIITVVGGRYAIQALQRYREQQALAEQKPDEKRRSEMSYDVALTRLSKSVCPGCERHVDLAHKDLDFCHHCGIALHNKCKKCEHRKSAFSKFCMCCGESAQESSAD